MEKIIYIDRQSGEYRIEKVFGEKSLQLLYGQGLASKLIQPIALPLICRLPFFSALYGWIQRCPFTARKIEPFIKKFDVDSSEFLNPISSYRSFNDFFIRRLKSTARPIAEGEQIAVAPADARYYFYQHLDQQESFIVKGERFHLEELLNSSTLASQYRDGSMLIARLCPSDYHRFHWPCSGIPTATRLINGWLNSVNPLAIRRNIKIFTTNKRTLSEIETENFGKILYMEVGATNVGSIHQTYSPGLWQAKGSEKGYFSFGASTLILLFAKGSIIFDGDLTSATQSGFEMRCLMGQRIGKAAYLLAGAQLAKKSKDLDI